MYTYNQANGNLSRNGELVGIGYSGFGEGKNMAVHEHDRFVGPIPRGLWRISAIIPDHPHLGRDVLPLEPAEGTCCFDRGGFYIHGDNASHLGDSSHGCIVIDHNSRLHIAESGDNELLVV